MTRKSLIIRHYERALGDCVPFISWGSEQPGAHFESGSAHTDLEFARWTDYFFDIPTGGILTLQSLAKPTHNRPVISTRGSGRKGRAHNCIYIV